MSRFFDLVTKPVREIGGYLPSPPTRLPKDEPHLIRLDSNENPLGPSPKAVEAMRAALAGSSIYPEDDCTELRRKVAALHDLPAEQVLVTAGSTGMLSLLCLTLLAPGLNAVTSERSFIVYGMATHAAGAQLIEAPMREDAIDLDSILHAINEHTRIVFLANPNNPTGTLLNPAALDQFLTEAPRHVVVVLDEAYYEFAAEFAVRRKLEYSRSLNYLQHGASVVVLRTFSKAHGLAGLRVGYGLGPAELLSFCARLRATFSVSSIAQVAALAALEDESHISRSVLNNAEQAQLLGVALSEMGIRVLPTWANFLHCNLGQHATAFAEQLRHANISVRPLAGWGDPTSLRVSIGTATQNQSLVETIRRLFETSGALTG